MPAVKAASVKNTDQAQLKWETPDSEVFPTIKPIGLSHCKFFGGEHLRGERGTDTMPVGPYR
jgi:hypothetical protein